MVGQLGWALSYRLYTRVREDAHLRIPVRTTFVPAIACAVGVVGPYFGWRSRKSCCESKWTPSLIGRFDQYAPLSHFVLYHAWRNCLSREAVGHSNVAIQLFGI